MIVKKAFIAPQPPFICIYAYISTYLFIYILFHLSFLLGFSSCSRSEDILLTKCPQGPSPHGGAIQRQPLPAPQIMCTLLRYQQSAQCYIFLFLFSVHFLFNRNVSRNMNLCLSLPPKGVVKNLEKLNIPLSHKRFSLHYSQFPFTLQQSWINTITLNCLIRKLHCDLKSCTFNNVIL